MDRKQLTVVPPFEDDGPFEDFRPGEEVLVHHARNRHFERAIVVEDAGNDQLRIRYVGTSFPIVVPIHSVLHDTPAAHAWLSVEYIPGGGTPGNPVHSAREAARSALWDDNPHLDQRAA